MRNVRKNKATTVLNRNGFSFIIGSSQSCVHFQKHRLFSLFYQKYFQQYK